MLPLQITLWVPNEGDQVHFKTSPTVDHSSRPDKESWLDMKLTNRRVFDRTEGRWEERETLQTGFLEES